MYPEGGQSIGLSVPLGNGGVFALAVALDNAAEVGRMIFSKALAARAVADWWGAFIPGAYDRSLRTSRAAPGHCHDPKH